MKQFLIKYNIHLRFLEIIVLTAYVINNFYQFYAHSNGMKMIGGITFSFLVIFRVVELIKKISSSKNIVN